MNREHDSDCSLHNPPAAVAGDCDCTLAYVTKLEDALADFQRLYSPERGGEKTDASFCEAYEKVWIKHRSIDLRTDDERPF